MRVTPEEFAATCQRAVAVAQELKATYESLRQSAEEIAGVSMVEWSWDEIERYVDLALTEWRKVHAAKLGQDF